MQTLFAPAIALLNRLGYTKKFTVMGVLALVAITILAENLYRSEQRVIDRARRELASLEMIKPIATLVQQLQVHRGFSSGVLNGDERMEYRRAAREKEATEALQAVAASLPPPLAAADPWQTLVAAWATIQKEGLKLPVRENFATHTALIKELARFLRLIADQNSLTNDPDIDSSYLIDTLIDELPLALESMGQLRAIGTGALTRKEALAMAQQVELAAALAGLNAAVTGLRQNLDKTAHYNPGLRPALEAASNDMGTAAEQFTTMVNDDILAERYQMLPAVYFAVTTRVIEKGYKDMFEILFPTLEQLLQQRVERAQRELGLSIAVVVLILLIYAYVSIGL